MKIIVSALCVAVGMTAASAAFADEYKDTCSVAPKNCKILKEDDNFRVIDYTAKKGDVSLQMYRKRVGAPKAGEPSKPVLFLVHGSSVTSRIV